MAIQENQLQAARNIRDFSKPEDQVRTLAYRLWEQRGSLTGNPDQDWALAQDLLRQVKTETDVKTVTNSKEVLFLFQVRDRYQQGGISQQNLAKEFGVTRYQVRKALMSQDFTNIL